MQFKLRLLPLAAVALALVACGDSTDLPTANGGIAADGYLYRANVYCNTDNTGTLSAANLAAKADAIPNDTGNTDKNGHFVFSKGCKTGFIVTGGWNDLGNGTSLPTPFQGILRAPPGATVVSPVSTLIAALVDKGKSTADAQDIINKALGSPVASAGDLLKTDPAQTLNGAFVNTALLKSNLIVQQLIQETVSAVAAAAGIKEADLTLQAFTPTSHRPLAHH